MDRANEIAHAEAVARAVAHMLDEVAAAMVVIWAEEEATCRLLSKARIDDPILALCPDPVTARQLSLYYGVISVQHQPLSSYEQWIDAVERVVLGIRRREPANDPTVVGAVRKHRRSDHHAHDSVNVVLIREKHPIASFPQTLRGLLCR
jgi:pyruvate kinase